LVTTSDGGKRENLAIRKHLSQNSPTTIPTVDLVPPSSDKTGPDEKNTMSLLDKVPGESKLYIGGWVLTITD